MASEVWSPNPIPHRPFEISTQKDGDVIVSTSASVREKAAEVLLLLKNGLRITRDWERYRNQHDKDNIYYDNRENPRFVAKVRTKIRPKQAKSKSDAFQRFGKTDTFDMMHSITNEFSLTDLIKTIIKSSEVQQIAMGNGFTSFGFAEPICVITERENKETRNKITIYNYAGDPPDMTDYDLMEKFDDIAWRLRNILLKNGIRAGDLVARQFVISSLPDGKSRKITLIDVEGYSIKRHSGETGAEN